MQGVEPRWKGLSVSIPVVMVSKRSYSILVAESHTGGKVSFQELSAVNNTQWEPLERLSNGEVSAIRIITLQQLR
jgi:hypothetical protein